MKGFVMMTTLTVFQNFKVQTIMIMEGKSQHSWIIMAQGTKGSPKLESQSQQTKKLKEQF